MIGTKLYAVYGTLKRGGSNHAILETEGSSFVGTDRICGFNMFDLGAYPGVKPCGEDEGSIEAEIFEVSSDEVHQNLDWLEGYMPDSPEDGLYDKRLTPTEWGDAWIYTYNGDVLREWELLSGNWEV